jgi:serine/threonine-protein kinase HipA
LAMACGDYGRYANVKNLLSQSARFLLTSAQAEAIVDEIEAVVKNRWYSVARGVGVSEADCDEIAAAFAYAGFRLKPPPA